MGLQSTCAPIFQVCRWIWNTLFHQCIAVLTIYAIWVPIEHYHNPFSWHVILCTLGILPFMAEALILFSNDNVWSQEILRRHKYWIHGTLFLMGTILVIAGIALEIQRKNEYADMTHFTSAHAVTGLICMILIIIALMTGPFAFTTFTLNKYAPPAWLKLAHNLLGQISYIMGIVSLCLGYYSDWFSFYTYASSRITATIVTSLVAVWSLLYSWRSLYRQIRALSGK